MAKIKTYVITLSKAFFKGHPRAGEPTNFEDALLRKQKIHTIRCNFPFWERRIREIQKGEAVLSIRQWVGKPYRSKQREITQLTAKDGIGIQKVVLTQSEWDENGEPCFGYWFEIGGVEMDIDAIARNDGFANTIDFVEWFVPAIAKQKPSKDAWRSLECAIIHFTNYRYI